MYERSYAVFNKNYKKIKITQRRKNSMIKKKKSLMDFDEKRRLKRNIIKIKLIREYNKLYFTQNDPAISDSK